MDRDSDSDFRLKVDGTGPIQATPIKWHLKSTISKAKPSFRSCLCRLSSAIHQAKIDPLPESAG